MRKAAKLFAVAAVLVMVLPGLAQARGATTTMRWGKNTVDRYCTGSGGECTFNPQASGWLKIVLGSGRGAYLLYHIPRPTPISPLRQWTIYQSENCIQTGVDGEVTALRDNYLEVFLDIGDGPGAGNCTIKKVTADWFGAA